MSNLIKLSAIACLLLGPVASHGHFMPMHRHRTPHWISKSAEFSSKLFSVNPVDLIVDKFKKLCHPVKNSVEFFQNWKRKTPEQKGVTILRGLVLKMALSALETYVLCECAPHLAIRYLNLMRNFPLPARRIMKSLNRFNGEFSQYFAGPKSDIYQFLKYWDKCYQIGIKHAQHCAESGKIYQFLQNNVYSKVNPQFFASLAPRHVNFDSPISTPIMCCNFALLQKHLNKKTVGKTSEI